MEFFCRNHRSIIARVIAYYTPAYYFIGNNSQSAYLLQYLLHYYCGHVHVIAQIGNALRCPASKFITHTLSHISFLILLAAATFRLDDKTHPISFNISTELLVQQRPEDEYRDRVDNVIKATFRPANILMTNVQICLMFWILGIKIITRSGIMFDVNGTLTLTIH